MCVLRAPFTSALRSGLGDSKQVGGLPGFAQSITVQWSLGGVQAGVGFLGLTEDSPCPSSRSDITFSVRVGSPWIDQVTKTTIDTLVEEVIVHSRYRAHRYWSWIGRANDIALLNLERPLQYSKYVWPICLPGLDYSLKDYSLCTVTGWGAPRVDGESAPAYSQQGGMCGREPGCRPGSTMDRNF